MPLNFSIDWTYNLMPEFVGQVRGFYSYRIDSNSLVSIESNQSSNDLYGNNFKYNPSFSYLVNISELTNGQHNIVIYGSIHGDRVGTLYSFSSPIEFFVQNPIHSPTPTVPEFNFQVFVIVLALIGVCTATIAHFKPKRSSSL